MSVMENFTQGKNKIAAGWPADKIIENTGEIQINTKFNEII